MPNIIKSSKPIKKIKFAEDFLLEEVIDPEEEERRKKEEEELRKKEEFENRVKEEVDKQVATALDEQKKELIDKYEKEKDEAYKKGFSDGEEIGIKEGKDTVKPLLENFLNVSKKLIEEKDWIIHNIEEELTYLCYFIAKKIIKKEVEKDEKLIIPIIKDSLRFISDETDIILKLNPEDYKTAQEYDKDLKIHMHDVKHFKIEADDKISRGGCLIETNSGEVDARLETKIEELSNLMLKE